MTPSTATQTRTVLSTLAPDADMKLTKAQKRSAALSAYRAADDVATAACDERKALKDSARIMGFPFEMGTRITEALPPAATGGKDISVHDIFDPANKSDVKSFYKAFHDMNSTKSCLGCHKKAKADGKNAPIACNACHPAAQ